MPNETVQTVLGTDSPSRVREAFWSLAEGGWSDPFVETLIVRLWDATSAIGPLGARLNDGIMTSILSHLLIKTGEATGVLQQVVLPRWRLKRVIDFVDRNLDKAISLDDLAAAAELSRRHFARSFCSEAGVTPHKWLMRRRLDRAQELLSTTDNSLTDIAQMCGFSSQSHLTSLMRQEVGLTPHKWRQHHKQ